MDQRFFDAGTRANERPGGVLSRFAQARRDIASTLVWTAKVSLLRIAARSANPKSAKGAWACAAGRKKPYQADTERTIRAGAALRAALPSEACSCVRFDST